MHKKDVYTKILTKRKKRKQEWILPIRIWLKKMWSIHSIDRAGFKITEIRSMPVDLYYIVTKKAKFRLMYMWAHFLKQRFNLYSIRVCIYNRLKVRYHIFNNAYVGSGYGKEKINYFEKCLQQNKHNTRPLYVHVTDTVGYLIDIPHHSFLLSKSTSQYRLQKSQKRSFPAFLAGETWQHTWAMESKILLGCHRKDFFFPWKGRHKECFFPASCFWA